MNPEAKQKWLEALRSGEYQQTTGVLYSSDYDGFCCLGVLLKCTKMRTREDMDGDAMPNTRELEQLGLLRETGQDLARINDVGGTCPDFSHLRIDIGLVAGPVAPPSSADFLGIADWIEKHL